MTDRTEEQDRRLQEAFLAFYARKGAIGPALRAAGATRSDLRRWREADDGFNGRMRDALDDAVDEAVEELRLRAVHGRDSLLFHAGQPVWRRDPRTGEVLLDDNFEPVAYTENERSDTLLALYVKAHRQEFREKGSVEVSGPNGGGIPLTIVTEYVLPEGKTVEDYERRDAGEGEEG